MSLDNRAAHRTDLDLLYVNKIIGSEPHLTRARDISENGIFLYKLLEPRTDEAQFGLEILLPGTHEVIWAVGEVTRKDTDQLSEGVGLRFVRISETDRDAIRRFVVKQNRAQVSQKRGKTVAA